jgi:hypothetical protein
MRILLAALLLLAFVQPVSAVVRLGYSPLDLFIPSKLMSINAAAARERYTQGNYLTSAFTQIFLCLVYLLPAAGGWNFEFCRHKRDRLLCAVTLAPALLVLMTQNTKAAFIGASFLFIGAFTAARIYRGRLVPRGRPQGNKNNPSGARGFSCAQLSFLHPARGEREPDDIFRHQRKDAQLPAGADTGLQSLVLHGRRMALRAPDARDEHLLRPVGRARTDAPQPGDLHREIRDRES